MLNTRVIPCLLLNNNRLVKTLQFNNPQYVGDPVNAVKIYNEKEVDEIIILDITATIEGRAPPFRMISKIASECFMPCTYGGGIHSIDDMKKIFHLGIEKIAINTQSVENPDFIKKAAERFGNQSIVISIDVKKDFLGHYRVWKLSGKQKTNLDPIVHAKEMESKGAGEILLTSIEKEGMMKGFDLEIIRTISSKIGIPLIACGGAGNLQHLKQAIDAGASAVAAGSMVVYQGTSRGVLINFPSQEELKSIFVNRR